MMQSTAGRYAVRSLGRHARRTLLSAVGVAIGCAVGLVTISWIRGESEMIVRAAAECGAGHLRITHGDWLEKHDRALRIADWQPTLERVRQLPGVKVATPRARSQGLLALGTRITSAEVVGVDPASEPAALRFVREVEQGRYLRPDDRGATVVGKGVLDKLDAQLGDELVVTVMGQDGAMLSALLTVVGVVATGSKNIDSTIVQVALPDMKQLSGLGGAAEITILLDDYRDAAELKGQVSQGLPENQAVLEWFEVAPELKAGFEMDEGFSNLTVGIVILLVLLGVMSAQLTSVLERRKEFAVLAALGMRGGQMVRVLFLEAVALGLLGAVLGLVLALPAVYYLANTGVDFSKLAGDVDMAMSGVLMDPIFYADFGAWLFPYALGLSMTATLTAAFYPALYATRTDPADALRVAQ